MLRCHRYWLIVQVLVDADAAKTLETLCRARRRRAAGEELAAVRPPESDPWPGEVVPLLQGHDCAIARTVPASNGLVEVSEVERLYLDMIDAAERFFYIENQYLTSAAIRDVLAGRLRRRNGPEIVIILPRETGDWLEQRTMDVLRARLLRFLREAGRHRRLRVYYPSAPGLSERCLMVHAKLMIVDDVLLRVGSSNLSNRSMGLDTECDLCVAARDDCDRAAIAGLRRRLLGMFLGLDQEPLAAAEDRENSLIATIESVRTQGRTLAPLAGETDPEWERQLPDDRLVDPDRPLTASDLSDAVVGQRSLPQARRRIWLGGGLVSALLVLAALWGWTGLGDWLQPQVLAASLTALLHGPWGPGVIVIGFVLGSLIAVPVTLLILVSALVYGPALGTLYAMVGSIAAAVATYGIGYYLGRPVVDRLSDGRIGRLSERLTRRGILTVAAVRIVPVAPFSVINLFAGASHIGLRDYPVGTLLGMIPGIAAMAVFAEGILALVRDADLKRFLVGALPLVFVVGLTLLGRRMFSQMGR